MCVEDQVNSGGFSFYWAFILLWVRGVGFENACTTLGLFHYYRNNFVKIESSSITRSI